MTARCEITELPVDMCSHYRRPERPSGVRTVEHPRPGWIEARYRGQCAACAEPFSAGALIAHDPETGGWLAECCADDGSEP